MAAAAAQGGCDGGMMAGRPKLRQGVVVVVATATAVGLLPQPSLSSYLSKSYLLFFLK